MIWMLARNRVKDYDHWRRVFEAQAQANQDSGLRIERHWRDVNDPDHAFFLFAVEDVERAKAFVEDPAQAAVGEKAGVIDGEYWFLSSADQD